MIDQMFRLTYGSVANPYPHSRELFTDRCFPVCSPSYFQQYPGIKQPESLATMPLIEIDWGAKYTAVPNWDDWFVLNNVTLKRPKPASVYLLSGHALEAAVNGEGVVLAQASFIELDLKYNRMYVYHPMLYPCRSLTSFAGVRQRWNKVVHATF